MADPVSNLSLFISMLGERNNWGSGARIEFINFLTTKQIEK